MRGPSGRSSCLVDLIVIDPQKPYWQRNDEGGSERGQSGDQRHDETNAIGGSRPVRLDRSMATLLLSSPSVVPLYCCFARSVVFVR